MLFLTLTDATKRFQILDWLYCAWRWLDKKNTRLLSNGSTRTNRKIQKKNQLTLGTHRVWSWSLVLLLNSCWFIVMLKFFVIGRCAYLDFGCTDLASSAISQLQTIFSLAEVVLLRKFPMYEYRWLIRIWMAKKLVLVYIVDSIFCRSF